MLREFDWCQLALIVPATKLLGQFAQHLPEQNGGLGRGMQSLQPLLCLELLDRLVTIDGVQQDIGVNGVHGVVRESGDRRRS
jgi:hypothetical protein